MVFCETRIADRVVFERTTSRAVFRRVHLPSASLNRRKSVRSSQFLADCDRGNLTAHGRIHAGWIVERQGKKAGRHGEKARRGPRAIRAHLAWRLNERSERVNERMNDVDDLIAECHRVHRDRDVTTVQCLSSANPRHPRATTRLS